VREAADVVADGGVIMIPTESFYGLGVDPRRSEGVARIGAMKNRAADMGLPVLCSDWQQIESLVTVPEEYRVRLSRLWPAALTVILPSTTEFPAGCGNTLAVRIPSHDALRALLYRVGPLTATSANRHGDGPYTTVSGALGSLASHPDLVLDAGPTAGGEPSTLVDLSGQEPTILRPGPVLWEYPYPGI
jgi:L-threonylcarbamoyladenylate synthase